MSDDTLKVVSVDDLEFNDAARVEWVRVQGAAGLLWKDNPKRHDLGAIIESIERYGFQERPKFDVNLPNVSGGTGAIVAGNGRVEALAAMERDKRYELPRGLAADASGAWCMPLLVGTDARSEEMAAAYGLDANNLTLSGGNLELLDMLSIWDEDQYISMLTNLAARETLPVSVSGDDVDSLLALTRVPTIGELEQEHSDAGERDFWPEIKVRVKPETYGLYQEIRKRVDALDDADAIARILEAVDQEKL